MPCAIFYMIGCEHQHRNNIILLDLEMTFFSVQVCLQLFLLLKMTLKNKSVLLPENVTTSTISFSLDMSFTERVMLTYPLN